MIRIIKPGTIPSDRQYHGRCIRCKAEIEFAEGDATVTDDQKDGTTVSLLCPTHNCGGTVYGTPLKAPL